MNIWSRLGIAVALLGIFCIACSEMIQRDGYYDLHRRQIAGALCGIGAIAYMVGRVWNRKLRLLKEQEERPAEESQEDEGNAGEPFALFDLAYWGPILAAFGLVVAFIPGKGVNATAAAQAAAPPKPKVELAAQTNAGKIDLKQTRQVTFPAVKLQGVTQRGTNSSALIDGRTYFLGEMVGNARLIAIFATSVVLELQGEMHSLTLPR
jgi:hypothetical protein